MHNFLAIILFIIFILTNSMCGAYLMIFINNLITKKSLNITNYIINTIIIIPFAILNFIILFKISNIKLLIPVLALLTCICVSKFSYKNDIYKSIIIGVIYIVVTFFIDILSSIVLSFFNIDLNFLNHAPTYYFIISIIIYSFISLFIKILCVIIKKNPIKSNITFNSIEYRYILYIAATIFICLIPSMLLLFLNNYNYAIHFVVINSLQLIIVSIFSVVYLKRQMHFKYTELELENTKLHNKALSTINESIRGFKHDMGNMVQAINGYLAVGNIDGVKNYCQNLLQGFNDINLLSILSPKVINDPAIYGVVVGKMLVARELGLTLSLDVGIDVSTINFPSFELSRIIGILLDNAIEASSESDNKKLKLEMYYDKNKNADIIIIGNSVKDAEKVDIIKMFEKNYSTKENPSGFGLYEVIKFFRKNNKGDINPSIDYDKNFFTQTLMFDK